jgi:hypothetical protein
MATTNGHLDASNHHRNGGSDSSTNSSTSTSTIKSSRSSWRSWRSSRSRRGSRRVSSRASGTFFFRSFLFLSTNAFLKIRFNLFPPENHGCAVTYMKRAQTTVYHRLGHMLFFFTNSTPPNASDTTTKAPNDNKWGPRRVCVSSPGVIFIFIFIFILLY